MEESYPHRPYADGGLREKMKGGSTLLTSRLQICKPDANKKLPLAARLRPVGAIGDSGLRSHSVHIIGLKMQGQYQKVTPIKPGADG